MDTQDPRHPHEPELSPLLDDEGRCLVCVLMCRMDEKASLRIAAARREGVIEGRAQAEAEMQSKIEAAVAKERRECAADVPQFWRDPLLEPLTKMPHYMMDHRRKINALLCGIQDRIRARGAKGV